MYGEFVIRETSKEASKISIKNLDNRFEKFVVDLLSQISPKQQYFQLAPQNYVTSAENISS